MNARHEALKKAAETGMGRAAAALSRLIGRQAVPDAPQIAEIAPTPERGAVSVGLLVHGDAEGRLLLILPAGSAAKLLRILIGSRQEEPVLDELAASALKETANILASAYLSALGDSLGLDLAPSIPHLHPEERDALGPEEGSEALSVESGFHWEGPGGERMEGRFYFFPEPAFLEGCRT